MIKNPSETKSDLICEECGEPIKQHQIDNKPIYCEFCGALNNFVYTQKQETLNKRRKQAPKSQLEQKEIRFSYTTEELRQEIRNLTYQKIYELVKTTFSVMRRLKHQEDLKQSQILKLAKKIRRALLSLSLPSDSAELLTKTSKKKIENYFEDFQVSLKKKKKNQSNYMPYLTKNIKFIYRLINGDYEFSTLAKYNQKAVKKLKKKYGFKINVKTKNSFSYSLSIFMCRKIYRSITALGHVLDLKQSKNELTKQYTLNTAKDITALVINNYFKRNLSKAYRKLKKDLEIDWVYRESFIEHVCSIIKLVYKLAYDNGYSSRLRGFQKLIAEDLKESAFFEDDTNFSPYLKLNLTLILSRIIHCVLDSSQNLTPLQSDPRKLNPTDNLRLASEIIDEILEKKKIKPEFLKKFYNLSLEEFQKEYEKLQAKLKSDMLYKENYQSFLQKLINSVYKITHIRSKKSCHSKIELAIIQDLANYNFNRESLKKEKSCFYSEGWDYDIGVKKLMLNKYFKITQREIKHYNRWLTDKIQNYIKNIDKEIKFLFEPFESFSKMDKLFGLGSNYICGQRMKKNSKKIIAVDILDRMRLFLKKNIQNWIASYPYLSDLLLDAKKGIIDLIDEYENKLSPKPSSRYQMYNHHPNFIRDFFKVINTKEKAYWLGFLFADGYITIERKASGYYYRMGIGLSTKDKKILVRFCNAVGLNPEYIKDRLVGSDFSNKKYQISMIRWGDQEFAQDLINYGIEYTYSEAKGRRIKTPNLPDLGRRDFKLAFLLGFYDGDGTLGYNKFTNRIQPSLASSDKDFLLQIKNYFDIKYSISSRVIEKYNLRKKEIVKTHANALNIGVKLFEEMIKNYRNSIERKKVDFEFFDGYYEPKAKPPTPQRVWLREKLPKSILKEIIKILSPKKISDLLGVHRSTIMNLIDEYKIYFFNGGHYLSIDRYIRYRDKDSEFYEPYHRWLDYLKKIGKFSNR